MLLDNISLIKFIKIKDSMFTQTNRLHRFIIFIF